MFKTKIARFGVLTAFALLALLAATPREAAPANEHVFNIVPWPDGNVPYKFDANFDSSHRQMVRNEMDVWETEMAIADPAGGPARKYITFTECPNCTQDYVYIRYNTNSEGEGNYCEPGMIPGKKNDLHFYRGTFGGCTANNTDIPNHPGSCNRSHNTIRHELGHCLGLYHEFNRTDADQWLIESPDEDGDDFSERPSDMHGTFAFWTRDETLMPLLGNYDYDSIMHYNYENVTDRMGNYFGRYNLDEGNQPVLVSKRDKSRLLQYYAWSLYGTWWFFESLSTPPTNPDGLPNPYLAGDSAVGGIWAVGTPAIAFQSPGNFDIFAPGSDRNLYWKSFRKSKPGDWVSLGCCFGSDPSAVSPKNGEIYVVAIGAETGKLIYKHFEGGQWGRATYVLDGYPTDGIKKASCCCTNTAYCPEYIGPAIASRDRDSLDVFVVRSDGLLAATTLSDGEWTAWRTLGSGYNVTARPAAVALSETTVKLAFNERGMYLYEGALTFAPAVPSFGVYRSAVMAYQTPPALTKRDDPNNPYRVLITNADGRISHRFATGSWRDIGGIPKPGTGPSAVATSSYGAHIVINGEDATGCTVGCNCCSSTPNQVIQPGGLWLREFE
jgi:hypothetical protein